MRTLMLWFVLSLFALPVLAQQSEPVSVSPILETAPSPGDGTTGVRVWVHPTNPAFSLILGADDNDGLGVYNLAGELVQFLEIGGVKHVDVRYNVTLGNRRISLIAAGIEDTTTVQLFTVNDDTLELEQIGTLETGVLQNGLCMYNSPISTSLYVFSISDDGSAEQWRIDGTTGEFVYSLERAFSIGSETEGCVVDDELRALYVAEESVAIWRYGAEPEQGTTRRIVDLTVPRGNITEEVEGLAIYPTQNADGYLIVTNQSSDSYLVYERRGENAFVGEFQIDASDTIDRVNESAAIDVVNLALTPDFPDGLFIAQDDTNSNPNGDNNFKLVSWGAIAHGLNLEVDTSVDVRNVGAVSAALVPVVTASLETAPVEAGVDAADDPALWLHPGDPALHLIIATDKTTGLVTYNLDGTIHQRLDVGRVNNVDIRAGFMINGVPTDLVATTNRTENSLQIFSINPETRLLEEVQARPFPSNVKEVYGVCMYISPVSGEFYVFVNSADTGEVEQYLLRDNGGLVDAEIVRTFVVGSQTEGCAADDETAALYIGEEAVGVWRYNAEPDSDDSRTQVDSAGEGGHLTADVEGIAIYYGENGSGYLIVSSQGSSEFAVYDRTGENAYIGSFMVIEGGAVDGVSGTDGIDVLSAGFGAQFPNGVFVAQDDLNIDPTENQNFKLVDWLQIAEALDLQ